MKRFLIFIFSFSFLLQIVHAQNLELPKIFSDNMVLQRGIPIPVWGWGIAGNEVKVEFNDAAQITKVGVCGNWKLYLPSMIAGGPYTLNITCGNEKITFRNILIGDVWFASGQSNMAWEVQKAKNAKEEIKQSNYPEIRLFTVPREIASTPQNDLNNGGWAICSSDTIGQFSAVAYYFGRYLHKELNVPIGLINSTWGGTPAEAWTSYDMLMTLENYKKQVSHYLSHPPNYDSIVGENAKNTERIKNSIENSNNGVEKGVHTINFADAEWHNIDLPCKWQHLENNDYNGFVWFRKTIHLHEDIDEGDLILRMGKIHGNHTLFVNGQELATIDNNVDFVKLNISGKRFNKGENVIALKILKQRNSGDILSHGPFEIINTRGTTIVNISEGWKYNSAIEPALPRIQGTASNPAALFNQMVYPVIPYGIKGIIWYQGEANASRAQEYKELFPAMITDWRIRWQLGYVPFLYVQLANFLQKDKEPVMDPWPELREAQLNTLKLPNTAMASAIDLGEEKDIHPKNKQDVGRRLAVAALNKAYNKDIVFSGPLYKEYSINGNEIEISFIHIGSGLMIQGEKGPSGFAIAGEDQKFVWANAKIVGEKIIVWSEKVEHPVAVRYGWSNNPDCSLYNKEGLPASPFRTDNWPGVTK